MRTEKFLLTRFDASGHSFWAGRQPHPTQKKIFSLIYNKRERKFSLRIETPEVSISGWKGVSPSKLHECHTCGNCVAGEVSSHGKREENFYCYGGIEETTVSVVSSSSRPIGGLLVQGIDDWSGTSFESSDGRDHPEDAVWDEIVWKDPHTCPVCGAGMEDEMGYCFSYEEIIPQMKSPVREGEYILGQICPECKYRARDCSPVPRHWEKKITLLKNGNYSDSEMSGVGFLREVFGITEDDFPEYGNKMIEFPQLNHFERKSSRGTIMWAIPTLVLGEDKSWRLTHREDAVCRIRAELKKGGFKINRNTIAIKNKLNF